MTKTYLKSASLGSAFWLEGTTLMQAPLGVDFEPIWSDSCEVDWFSMDPQDEFEIQEIYQSLLILGVS